MTDVVDDLDDLVDANWDTNIVAKPTFARAAVVTSVKVRRKHTTNTIYYFRYENKKPKVHAFTRDLQWRVPVLLVGTSWAQLKLVEQGFEDAIHEYLSDAGRTYQHLEVELGDISVRKPRESWRLFGYVHVWKFGESITT